MSRLDLTGHPPVVEYRSSLDRYFICYPELKVELAPSFKHRFTAQEIAVNAFYGTPFFTMIPVVPYGTAHPRPGIVMPKLRPLDIEMRVV